LLKLKGKDEFNYEDKGPDAWPFLVNPKCGGEKQSPIDIFKCDTIYIPTFKDYTFKNYDGSVNWNVSHDGHTSIIMSIKFLKKYYYISHLSCLYSN
jgi:carbonic anhydrase